MSNPRPAIAARYVAALTADEIVEFVGLIEGGAAVKVSNALQEFAPQLEAHAQEAAPCEACAIDNQGRCHHCGRRMWA